MCLLRKLCNNYSCYKDGHTHAFPRHVALPPPRHAAGVYLAAFDACREHESSAQVSPVESSAELSRPGVQLNMILSLC